MLSVDYLSVQCIITLNPDLKRESLIFFSLWITKYYLWHPLIIYSFDNRVFSIWFVYGTILGAEKKMLSKMYVSFYTFNLVGQTDDHTSSNGESTGLVNHRDSPGPSIFSFSLLPLVLRLGKALIPHNTTLSSPIGMTSILHFCHSFSCFKI